MNSGYLTGSSGDRTYFYYHSREDLENDLSKNGLVRTYLADKEYLKSDGPKEIHRILIAQKCA